MTQDGHKIAAQGSALKNGASKRQKEAMARSLVKATRRPHGSVSMEAVNPDKAMRVLEKLAQGVPYKQICREEGTTFDTVVGMRRRHCTVIEDRKEMVAGDALELMEGARLLQLEKMRELAEDPEALKKVNLRDLALSYGAYGDKFFQAAEGNKMVVEHKVGAVSIDDALKAIQDAKAKLKAASVEVNVTPTEGKEAQ